MIQLKSLSVATHDEPGQGVALAIAWDTIDGELVAHIDAANFPEPGHVLTALKAVVDKMEGRAAAGPRRRFNPRPA